MSLGELLATSSGRWTVALEVIATVFMLPFMYIGAAMTRESGHGMWGVVDALLTSAVRPQPCKGTAAESLHTACLLHSTGSLVPLPARAARASAHREAPGRLPRRVPHIFRLWVALLDKHRERHRCAHVCQPGMLALHAHA